MVEPKIFIVTGEASGDLHGANLASAIRQLRPNTKLIGVGGHKMEKAGVQLVPGIDRVDAMGVPGLRQLWKGLGTIIRLKKILRLERFDAVVFIDSPSMNLRLAKTAAKAKLRVIYYIAPQIWAWGARRITLIRRVVNRMIVILPFEESIYRRAGVPCNFVGHPLLDVVAPDYDKQALRAELGLEKNLIVLGLLPGSREKEVQSFLPIMVQAAQRMVESSLEIQCVIAQSPSVPPHLIQDIVGRLGLKVKIIENQPNEVMAVSDLLLVASGTATLQAAIIGTPMIIAYRASWITYQFAKRLIKINYIGLVNIVAGQSVVPELIQDDMTPERLSEEAVRLLKNPKRVEEMRQAFHRVRKELGAPGASTRAAELVLAEVQA